MRKTTLPLLLATAVLAFFVSPATAGTLSGKISEYVNGKEQANSGVTIVIGKDIWLDTSSNIDTVKRSKNVVAKASTNAKGEFSVTVPDGSYTIILWKGGYVPSSNTVKVPGKFNNSISKDRQTAKHQSLKYEN